MIVETLLFTVAVVFLSCFIWWLWREKQRALAEVGRNERLAELGRDAGFLGHDLGNILASIPYRVADARAEATGEQAQLLEHVERAATAASSLARALQNEVAGDATHKTSAEGLLRLHASLCRWAGAKIRIRVDGDLAYDGAEVDASRVVQNLIQNAVREAVAVGTSEVCATLGRERLEITNSIRECCRLENEVYLQGKSHSQSSGLGLAIVKELAARVGWSVRHELGAGEVTFVVETAPS